MGDFVQVRELPRPRRIAELTPEAQNYKAFKTCGRHTEASPVVGLSFCPAAPHRIAAVSGTKISLWRQGKDGGFEADSVISKFKDLTQCAAWRNDGRLLLAGEAGGSCAVIQSETRKVLRRFHGHKDAVTCANFAAFDKARAATGGRDGKFNVWDVATGELVQTIDGHDDCMKSLAPALRGPDTWVSAGRDGHVRLWDLRAAHGAAAGARGACVIDMDHGHPVESGVVFPGGGMYVSAGGTGLKSWDLTAGGRTLQELNDAHSKMITAVSLDSASSVMLSASIDGLAKIYHAADLKHLWTYKFAGPINCVAWRPDSIAFAVGLESGDLLMRQRRTPEDARTAKLIADKPEKPWAKREGPLRGKDAAPDSDDEVVRAKRPAKQNQGKLDFFIRKFEYRKAIEFIVTPSNAISSQLGFAVMDELLHQGALGAALSELGDELCGAALTWLLKAFNTVDSLQLHLFLEVLHTLFDCNRCLQPPATPKLIDDCRKLNEKVTVELCIQEKCLETSGMLKTIMTL
mmetsp:Transcript_24893/g.70061  ORF Transcript_24893/g.70061 Transcript_24893/m.70061 type:complete len:518 (-) Transcript_24893:93-1646(-)